MVTIGFHSHMSFIKVGNKTHEALYIGKVVVTW
nr:MAG TPA: hypothetical protein [Caudoviricetes sp.]